MTGRKKWSVLIFGGNGWLGQKFHANLGRYGFITWSGGRGVDITNPYIINRAIDTTKPDLILNCAGKTGRPNIDWCEDHKEETWLSNVKGPETLLNVCLEKGIKLVHLSSGCIFDGLSPNPEGFIEEDSPDPVSYYSWTKVWAERILKPHPVLILRLRMPVDKYPSPRNLITKLAGYKKIIDVLNSVTVVDDLVRAAAELMHKGKTGIYHVVNPGPVRHRDIMEWYKEIVDPSHSYEMIPPEELLKQGLAIAGRSNCVLSAAKLEREGICLPNAEWAIKQCLKRYKIELSDC